MATLQERLARLQNYSTRYELAIIGDDGQRVLLAYANSKSRNTVLKCARTHGEKLVSLTGSEDITFAKKAGDGAKMGAFTIRFTGRTQRECYIEGELPFIGD